MSYEYLSIKLLACSLISSCVDCNFVTNAKWSAIVLYPLALFDELVTIKSTFEKKVVTRNLSLALKLLSSVSPRH